VAEGGVRPGSFLIVNAEQAETASKAVKNLDTAMMGMSKQLSTTYLKRTRQIAQSFIAHYLLAW
jgi:hypothetical protein